jgi:bacillithiol system protein YtxJ
MNWKKLTTEQQLKEIIQASYEKPQMIFKHSTRCSISSTALNRLERSWNDTDMAGLEAYYLDLIAYRPVSNAVAQHLNIQHQSPQVLIIKDGECSYTESHMGINYTELKDLSKQLAG